MQIWLYKMWTFRCILNQILLSKSNKAIISDINHIYKEKDINDSRKGIGFIKIKIFINFISK
jgi:hypothetical protein